MLRYLNNSLLKDGRVLEDALERKPRQVDASELARGQQLRHCTARSRRLLQTMAGEPVAEHKVRDIRVMANDSVLKSTVQKSGK